jgi:DNA polymerase delta subunit 1
MIDVFPVDWAGVDHVPPDADQGDARYEIRCWGKSSDGESVLLRIAFTPYFFVATPGWSQARQRLFITTAMKLGALPGLSMPVERKSLLGFFNNRKFEFVQLAFATHKAFRSARYAIPKYSTYNNLKTYEASLDPLLRFYHLRDISPSSWVRANADAEVEEDADDRVAARGVREFLVDFKNVGPSQCSDRPRLVIASWDLECVSDSLKFPNSDMPLDHIITIGTAFQRYGESEPYHRSVVTLGTCDPIEGVEVVPCASEADVIMAWLDQLHEHGTDVMVGYNTFGFDFRYLFGRSQVCFDDAGEPLVHLGKLGKAKVGGGVVVEKNLSSNAFGDNKFFYLTSPGIMQLDLLQTFRKELKLESFSLANVSKKFLEEGEVKLDLKPGEIFVKFKEGPSERAEIAIYCIRDVELPLKLMRRLTTLENALEMSNATCIPIDYLQTRGQQIRVYSQLIRKARSMGFVAPDMERDAAQSNEKYEGATVLEAQRGAYFEVISALDFASLYPSIMMAHNLCPSTLVTAAQFENVEGVEYHTVETGQGVHKFAQRVDCVVPNLLKELAQFRKKAKREMAIAKSNGDVFAESLCDAQQKAYKVSMNSVYGFFGAVKGIFPCVPIAASTTAIGRQMIEHSKQMAETLVPGTRVVYGDSVSAVTPIVTRHHDYVRVLPFERLEDTFPNDGWSMRADGKEVCVLEDVDVWCDAGWAPLLCVIRHALHPSKNMVRVVTRAAGVVDVTDDHSLILEDGTTASPKDLPVGAPLMHAALPKSEMEGGQVASVSCEEARIMGYFLCRGHAGQGNWFLALDLGNLRTYQDLCQRALYGDWAVEAAETAFEFRLAPSDPERVEYLEDMALRLQFCGTSKIVPHEVLNGPKRTRVAFLEGMHDALAGASCFRDSSQITVASVALLLASLGMQTAVSMPASDVYELRFVENSRDEDRDGHRIISMTTIKYVGFVYDCSVGNTHRFGAGVGSLVVHNTDSILCHFKVDEEKRHDVAEHFKVAQRVADAISATFADPILLEFEKVYYPYLLLSKKRYAGRMFTQPEKPDYIDVKGLQLVRRDNAPIVKDVSTRILNAIMHDRSPDKAIEEARTCVAQVLGGHEPIEKFIISKLLRSNYVNPKSQPHCVVAQKIKERRGYPVTQGERVPYVFVEDPLNSDGLISARAEDPAFVMEHPEDIKLDLLYYIQNQMISPIETLLALLVPDVNMAVLQHPGIKEAMEELQERRKNDVKLSKRVKTNARNNQKEITSFFAFRSDPPEPTG